MSTRRLDCQRRIPKQGFNFPLPHLGRNWFEFLKDEVCCKDNPHLSVSWKLDRTKAWVNAGQDVCAILSGIFEMLGEIGILS